MPEYDGSGQGAPNPNSVDTSGDGTLGGMIGAAFGALSQAVQDALNITGQLLGVPAAQASSYPVVNSLGVPIGYLVLPGMGGGLTLAQGLAKAAAAIDISSGMVRDRMGNPAGFVDLDSTNTGGPPMIGPINIDLMTQNISTSTPAGVAITAQVPGALALQLNTIDGFPLKQTTRLWRPTIVTTWGVPIVDYNNSVALFSWNPQVPAYLHPAFIGGKDGIYSIHKGTRVVPDASVGPAPAGFGVGNAATFARANFAVGWTSGGRAFAWWNNDVQHVIDPSTGQIPVIVAYYEMQCWDGSQQISTFGYQYDTPTPPHAGSPGFNTAVSGKIAYSNYAQNAAFVGYQGNNPGGPDGGPSH
jgi:hypothetical protein